MTSGVYCIVCNENGKTYCGSSVIIERRWSNHLWELRNRRHKLADLQADFEKYGEDSFELEVVAEEQNPELRLRIEATHINRLIDKGMAYNKQRGKEKVTKSSEMSTRKDAKILTAEEVRAIRDKVGGTKAMAEKLEVTDRAVRYMCQHGVFPQSPH